ncbi:hypothetical protein GCM10010862_02250 [Devosia nitrariae]|uniref:Uncharacterized protein n=1 Tax=Devosia nitrariae TaxID=2071872 RepID=A0ABQ5VYR7_9HYPH|nr:hypothetical protein GCM10010862_02250 [Devosia nitrariae]
MAGLGEGGFDEGDELRSGRATPAGNAGDEPGVHSLKGDKNLHDRRLFVTNDKRQVRENRSSSGLGPRLGSAAPNSVSVPHMERCAGDLLEHFPS